MSTQQNGQDYALHTTEDLSAKQFYAVALDTSDGEAIAITAAGQRAIGILQNDPDGTIDGGDTAVVRGFGFALARFGGTVAAGDRLTTNATGELVKSTGANDHIVGVALAAQVDNDLGPVSLGPDAARVGTHLVEFKLPGLAAITGAGDVITGIPMQYAGRVLWTGARVVTPATTAAKAATLNWEIGTTNLTGGAIALTSANCTPAGAVIAGSAITGANEFAAGDLLSLEASSVTAFAEGEVTAMLVIGPA